MTRPTSDLHLHVSTTSDGSGLRETARDLDKTTKSAEKTKKATDQLGDSFHDAVRDTKDFNEQLRKLYVERYELAKSYQESGDREVMQDFNRTNRRIAMLEKFSKALATSGAKGSAKLVDFGGEGIKPRNYAIGGLVVALAAAMPALGAMLSGAFSGTLVGAAMAGGIVAASQDHSVQEAASQFGETISREFFASGDAFVTPIRNSLNSLEADFQDLELEAAFAKAAPYVEMVADGIGNLAKNFMPGFNKLLDRAGPYSQEFADGLAGMGSALGDFADQISGSEGSVEGLNTLFRLLNGTIVALGMTLNTLADTWDVYTDLMGSVASALGSMPDWLQKILFGHSMYDEADKVFKEINKSGFGAADGINAAGDAASNAGPPTRDLAKYLANLNDEFQTFFETNMSVDEARLAVERGFLELQQTLKENGNEWDSYTEKGIENRQAVLDQVDALNKRREAEIKASDGSEESVNRINKNYDKAIAKLKLMALNAGMTEQAFEELAGEYTITFFLQQKVGKQVVAWSELRNAERKMESSNSGSNKPREYAAGGTTPANEVFKVHKDELMWSDRQHYVSTKAQSEQLARMGGAGGSQNLTLTLMPGGSDPFTRALVELLSRYMRISGGNGAALGITHVG